MDNWYTCNDKIYKIYNYIRKANITDIQLEYIEHIIKISYSCIDIISQYELSDDYTSLYIMTDTYENAQKIVDALQYGYIVHPVVGNVYIISYNLQSYIRDIRPTTSKTVSSYCIYCKESNIIHTRDYSMHYFMCHESDEICIPYTCSLCSNTHYVEFTRLI